MDEIRDKRYTREIISEYATRFVSWGPPESWDLDQFKTLENLIQEATDITVNANTLKRFFQQRTGNPQLATRDALCRFLGYTGYTDFVSKHTKTEEGTTDNNNEAPENKPTEPLKKSKSGHTLTYILITLLVIVSCYLLYILKIKDLYTDHLLSKINFSASDPKGANPLTVSFSYDIPASLLKDIKLVYEEANGDTSEKHLNKSNGQVNATYIFEGDGYCHLQYKGHTIKTITIENRKPGWSVYTRNERKGIFKTLPISQAYNKDGYASLPLDSVVAEARPGHLFVSYVYYQENLVDGDNFMLEARVRNAAIDHAIPRSDVMMYLLSDTGRHGFALNEAGYAYIKFISSEKSIKGDEYNLSKFSFDASAWHVMAVRVQHKRSAFYLDGQEIYHLDYTQPIGTANEIILRFKGCGAVDYVKLHKPDGQVVYEQHFNNILQ
ncbi:hypothetical protein [Chitinophaga qingshengii]|uniref:Uncharacterized protein n=1 Tax=Chitinophaga qingshengii TaxID=1569794 RepID=A0ABR7TYP2_9BACT|nr:hypothetical protein [Chitinophaga qingshengii]MBC9934873.1 hypothetical protein [Chitinophaga qingshengii]